MLIRIFDGDESVLLHLYKVWWLVESWLRLKPKQLIATPDRGVPQLHRGRSTRASAPVELRWWLPRVQRVMDTRTAGRLKAH